MVISMGDEEGTGEQPDDGGMTQAEVDAHLAEDAAADADAEGQATADANAQADAEAQAQAALDAFRAKNMTPPEFLSAPEREYYNKICVKFGITNSVFSSLTGVVQEFVKDNGRGPTHVLIHPALMNALNMELRHMSYGLVRTFMGADILVSAECKFGCGILELKK